MSEDDEDEVAAWRAHMESARQFWETEGWLSEQDAKKVAEAINRILLPTLLARPIPKSATAERMRALCRELNLQFSGRSYLFSVASNDNPQLRVR